MSDKSLHCTLYFTPQQYKSTRVFTSDMFKKGERRWKEMKIQMLATLYGICHTVRPLYFKNTMNTMWPWKSTRWSPENVGSHCTGDIFITVMVKHLTQGTEKSFNRVPILEVQSPKPVSCTGLASGEGRWQQLATERDRWKGSWLKLEAGKQSPGQTFRTTLTRTLRTSVRTISQGCVPSGIRTTSHWKLTPSDPPHPNSATLWTELSTTIDLADTHTTAITKAYCTCKRKGCRE